MEWGHLPHGKNCKHFGQWVKHFYTGGYISLDAGKMSKVDSTERDKHFDIVWAHSSVL